MSFAELFPHVDEWSGEILQSFLDSHHPDDYQLLDLRQERDFVTRHLPGARHLSMLEFKQWVNDLNPSKTTIVYCRNGVRSHAAAQVLIRSGFADVHSLRGGFVRWQRPAASKPLPAIFAHDAQLETAEAHALYAWQLEENAHRFYSHLAEVLGPAEPASVFAELAADETQHKETVKAIWEGLSGCPASANFPEDLAEFSPHDLMEGGMKLNDALRWAVDRPALDLLDYAMAVEVNAYDHYLALQHSVDDENVARLFELLADEEGRHLRRLSQTIEAFSSPDR